jgi:hypothetical protein
MGAAYQGVNPQTTKYAVHQKRTKEWNVYEKVSIRFACSLGNAIADESERAGALGLLSPLVPLSPHLRSSPLLAPWLLVCRLLVSGLLGLEPRSSRGGSPILNWTSIRAALFRNLPILGNKYNGRRA